jgi:hypothetical protein
MALSEERSWWLRQWKQRQVGGRSGLAFGAEETGRVTRSGKSRAESTEGTDGHLNWRFGYGGPEDIFRYTADHMANLT